MYSPSDTSESILLSWAQVQELEQLHPGVSKAIADIRKRASDAQGTQTITELTQEYADLATEHAELISSGKTSVEIATWLGEGLSIVSWSEWKFHGERKTLPTPTEDELVRLRKFTRTLGVNWKETDGGSKNIPTYFLLAGNVQNALFGQKNMEKTHEKNILFDYEWQELWGDMFAKMECLQKKIGLVRRIGDMDTLTGIRVGGRVGEFEESDSLYVSGHIEGNSVNAFWLTARRSALDKFVSDLSMLCLLD